MVNEAKPARDRLTLIRIYEELRGQGYQGGYDTVRRYARRWRREHASLAAQAFVPLSFAPGEAYQFDWSHEVVVINGVTMTVKAAHVRLCHSRMMFVRVYPRESQEMMFDAHDRAFAFFKGACTRGIYDSKEDERTVRGTVIPTNKTAVDTIFVGKKRAYVAGAVGEDQGFDPPLEGQRVVGSEERTPQLWPSRWTFGRSSARTICSSSWT